MANDALSNLTPEKILAWRHNLRQLDPSLSQKIEANVPATMTVEAAALGETEVAPPFDVIATIETMVRPGRPVLPIKNDKVVRDPAFIEEPGGALMVDRIVNASAVLAPVIPLVGRIDVANYPRNVSYVGTGWLVAPDLIVTNSHVAELIGRRDGRRFSFLPGRFGDPIGCSVDWKHEMDARDSLVSPIEEILFIESRKVADIAFLRIKPRADGAQQTHIPLADSDAGAGTSVAVIGYPARAGEDVIPDQEWMNKVFSGRYDVKRAAPGVMTPDSHGWATHDCTTLGGNSGSAVIDLKTGKAVALHFAGAYVIENYAVPASTIRRYLDRRWTEAPPDVSTDASAGDSSAGDATTLALQARAVPSQTTSMSITLPLTITLSIGDATNIASATLGTGANETAPIEEAVRLFQAAYRGGGILGVRSGLVIHNREFTDTLCISVVTQPDKVGAVRARCPAAFLGHPVEVRPASVVEMVEGQDPISEAAGTSIAYNDEARGGPEFSFDPVDENMEVLCCVGPERSWSVLSQFIEQAQGRMVSSIYEFHAKHIADAIEKRLSAGVDMTLVMDNATRLTSQGVKNGDFNRRTVFRKWAKDFHFDRVYVPEGPTGLVANSYHIKVTVDDADRFWLSSGNWKNSSQPNIAPADLDNPTRIKAKKGNREWHVVVGNKTLAGRYRSHILADMAFSRANGGTLEAIAPDIFIDVPIAVSEAIELEAAAPGRIFEPLHIRRSVKVKPLLTPDRLGKIYTEAVLDLIESAEEELLFQIPYIDSYKPAARGNLEKLVKALVRKSREIETVHVILRSDHGTWIPCAEDLKKRRMNIKKCLRVLPSTHTKGMVVDGRRALIGSHNWSGGGVTFNRDASLLFDDADVANYYKSVFEVDWARAAKPIIPESALHEAPRIADPESPVPAGFRRMTLEEFLEG